MFDVLLFAQVVLEFMECLPGHCLVCCPGRVAIVVVMVEMPVHGLGIDPFASPAFEFFTSKSWSYQSYNQGGERCHRLHDPWHCPRCRAYKGACAR